MADTTEAAAPVEAPRPRHTALRILIVAAAADLIVAQQFAQSVIDAAASVDCEVDIEQAELHTGRPQMPEITVLRATAAEPAEIVSCTTKLEATNPPRADGSDLTDDELVAKLADPELGQSERETLQATLDARTA